MMNTRHVGNNPLICAVSLLTILLTTAAFAAISENSELVQGNSRPENLKTVSQSVAPGQDVNPPLEKIVSELSDDQVRRMLIEELRKGAQQTVVVPPQKKKFGGIASLIKKIRSIGDMIQWRIYALKSGFETKPGKLPSFFRLLAESDAQINENPFKAIFSVVGLLVAGLIVFWSLQRIFYAIYRRNEKNRASEFKLKIVGSGLRSMLDFIAVCLFAMATLTIFYTVMERTQAQSTLVLTYLTALLIVLSARLLLRFFLSPKSPGLRFLPLDEHTALYLFRWLMAIAIVSSFGFLTCGMLRVAGMSEAKHLAMVALVELVITAMIVTMILQKREQVKYALIRELPGSGLRDQMANIWHYLAIVVFLFLWLFSTFNLLLFGVRPGAPGIQTLLMVPIYFLLDWMLRTVSKIAGGGSPKTEDVILPQESGSKEFEDTVIQDSGDGDDLLAAETPKSNIKKHMNVDRISRIVGGGLRLVLMILVIFYLLHIWGLKLDFGKAVMRGAFSLFTVALIFYVAWEFFSAAIQRRLSEEVPALDEDMEEGGAGGSRVGTLLLLLRKFILAALIVMATLIVLSAMGINIGPLIAGAGVIGLAIGFGAQTLVKDIISGIFFLIDDAFRVGDYIETAGTKGMVEHISLRSLRLRHPRGMVNTIPFGDIGIVTNMSRDYIITKLDFRVRYDTDVERVRKIIKKKVYEPIMKNEELAPKLLEAIKSQGVREMDDSAMIMRVKYKTRPGEQFAVRKEVYRLMQEAFKEEGIEFAHRNVTVYLPPETDQAPPEKPKDENAEASDSAKKKLMQARGAAAAIAAAQVDAGAKKPKAK